jgi:hypothetical protein
MTGGVIVTVITMISSHWRGPVRNPEMNALHAEGFGHELLDDDWEAQTAGHSLGWVCARAAGCEWLHVDFEEHLRSFYVDRCGFRPTPAGLIAL